MKYLIYLLCSISLLAQSGFEKKSTKENVEAMENEKIKCRWVCDKKLYREQKIAEAISFYKNSKEYSFSNKKSQ
ncbi:MAG: hypothetical protein JXQ67_06295 [Campylobacterales bacterium]|nr:hypothetical protein [Campylobacterales bacterium]